jgi:hypothetical protein
MPFEKDMGTDISWLSMDKELTRPELYEHKA